MSLEAEVAQLRLRVIALEAKVAGGGATTPAREGQQEPKDVRFLATQLHWADNPIRRDPPKWTGPSGMGFAPSNPAISAEYLDDLASFTEWKAGKDKTNPDAKKNAKGKPYWEGDLLMASVYRGWAKAKRDGTVNKILGVSEPKQAEPTADSYEASNDDIPF